VVTSIFSHFNPGSVTEQDNYPILPGIEVVKMDFKTSGRIPTVCRQMNVLEINHCFSGRAECQMQDGCFQYIGEGDLFMSALNNYSEIIELPLGYYSGMAVIIDIDSADKAISELLPNIPIHIRELANRFFADDECFFIQAKEEIRNIFSGMYTIPRSARYDYYKIKILELLIFLHYFDPSAEKQKRTYERQQVEIVKQIQKQITSEPEHRFTIDELARKYCISPTTLKSNFKGVYGVSIAAYMKEYRVRQAAFLLRQTEQSVGEIALAMGYESQSKFGAAFKEIMKITPMEYRKRR